MNTCNAFKTKLLAVAILFVALLVPVSVFAQKSPKEQKKQVEQKSEVSKQKESAKQKEAKGPKKQKEQKVKAPKSENTKQKEPKEQKKQTEQSEVGKQKEQKVKAPKSENVKQKEPKEQKKQTVQSEVGEEKEQKVKENTKQKEPKEPKEKTKKAGQKEKAKKQKIVDETLISVDEVPVAVMKAYKKRYASAVSPVWNFYKEEQIYKVTCVYRNIPTVISYTSDGIWTESLENLPVDKLSATCTKTINARYKNYKINSLKKLTTSTKNNMFIVGLFESQNIKRKLETIVYLDALGKYIRSEAPEIEEESAGEKTDQKEKQKKQKPVDTTLITTSEVPVAVMKTYRKRYASAVNPVWNFYKEEQIYKVTCVYRNIPIVMTYKSDGTWTESIEEFTVDKLNSACIKTIDTYYKNYKVNSLKKLTTNTKNDMFIIGLFENQNIKKRLETTVYLDLSGGYIRSEDPVEEESPIVEQAEQVDKKQEKTEKRLRKKFEKEMQIDDAPIRLSGKELPPSVQGWISKNYPEYIYKDVTYGNYEDFEDEGSVYQIVIQKDGINQPHATVWFTRDGNFLKLEDNFREETFGETTTESSNEITNERTTKEKDKEKRTAKETSLNDEPSGYSVEESEVKEEIITAFNTKYPRAKDVSWEENEGIEWIVSFTDQQGQNTAIFSDKSKEWIYTKTLLPDISKIPGVVRNNLAKNYPQKQIMKGWMIRTADDTKPYYTVELYTKKGKITEYFDFLQNGKLKEE